MFKRSNVRRILKDVVDLVVRQDAEIDRLQLQVAELSRRIARLPQPMRPNWMRQSGPSWERETLTLPMAVARSSSTPLPPTRALRPIPLVCAPSVKRVVLIMGNGEQFVRTYDESGKEIPRLSGAFRDVGLKVLEAAGKLEWDVQTAA